MTAAALLTSWLLATTASASTLESSPTPLADAFWSRDLAKTVAYLASPPALEEKQRPHLYPLFSDLVRLVRCEPQPPVPEKVAPVEKALRTLIRLEESRRYRLGDTAPESDTIWRDILTPGYFEFGFQRDDGELLIWPVEEELWSGEEIRAKVRPPACDRWRMAPPSIDEIPSAELIDTLQELAREDPAFQAVAAVALYRRASDAFARGRLEEAHALAQRLQPAFVPWPRLAGYASLLRLETGVDPPDGYARLVGTLDRAGDSAARVRAAHAAMVRGDWQAVLALSESAAELTPCEPRLEIERDLVARRAVALDALRRDAELELLLSDTFPWCAKLREPSIELLRDVAIRFYARKGVSHARLEVLDKLAPPAGAARVLRQYGAWALRRGDLTAARVVSSKLRTLKDLSARTRGWTLEAEIAFWLQDAPRFEQAVVELFPPAGLPDAKGSEREERDRAAVELAQALVVSSTDKATETFKRGLHAQLIRMRDHAALRREDAFAALLLALEPKPLVAPAKETDPRKKTVASYAIGDVDLSLRGAIPPPPAFTLAWPEPFSLLGIPAPTPTGWTLRPWFPPSPEAVHAQK